MQEEMRNAEKAGLTTAKPETTFEEMLNAIGDSLSNLACSNDREDGDVRGCLLVAIMIHVYDYKMHTYLRYA